MSLGSLAICTAGAIMSATFCNSCTFWKSAGSFVIRSLSVTFRAFGRGNSSRRSTRLNVEANPTEFILS